MVIGRERREGREPECINKERKYRVSNGDKMEMQQIRKRKSRNRYESIGGQGRKGSARRG